MIAFIKANRKAALPPENWIVCSWSFRLHFPGWEKNRSVYGARKLWHTMKREKIDIARCTVERLMRPLGVQGVRRGKKIKTTYGQPADQCPVNKVNRQFRASQPNEL